MASLQRSKLAFSCGAGESPASMAAKWRRAVAEVQACAAGGWLAGWRSCREAAISVAGWRRLSVKTAASKPAAMLACNAANGLSWYRGLVALSASCGAAGQLWRLAGGVESGNI
jgi:hypothetical protein